MMDTGNKRLLYEVPVSQELTINETCLPFGNSETNAEVQNRCNNYQSVTNYSSSDISISPQNRSMDYDEKNLENFPNENYKHTESNDVLERTNMRTSVQKNFCVQPYNAEHQNFRHYPQFYNPPINNNNRFMQPYFSPEVNCMNFNYNPYYYNSPSSYGMMNSRNCSCCSEPHARRKLTYSLPSKDHTSIFKHKNIDTSKYYYSQANTNKKYPENHMYSTKKTPKRYNSIEKMNDNSFKKKKISNLKKQQANQYSLKAKEINISDEIVTTPKTLEELMQMVFGETQFNEVNKKSAQINKSILSNSFESSLENGLEDCKANSQLRKEWITNKNEIQHGNNEKLLKQSFPNMQSNANSSICNLFTTDHDYSSTIRQIEDNSLKKNNIMELCLTSVNESNSETEIKVEKHLNKDIKSLPISYSVSEGIDQMPCINITEDFNNDIPVESKTISHNTKSQYHEKNLKTSTVNHQYRKEKTRNTSASETNIHPSLNFQTIKEHNEQLNKEFDTNFSSNTKSEIQDSFDLKQSLEEEDNEIKEATANILKELNNQDIEILQLIANDQTMINEDIKQIYDNQVPTTSEIKCEQIMFDVSKDLENNLFFNEEPSFLYTENLQENSHLSTQDEFSTNEVSIEQFVKNSNCDNGSRNENKCFDSAQANCNSDVIKSDVYDLKLNINEEFPDQKSPYSTLLDDFDFQDELLQNIGELFDSSACENNNSTNNDLKHLLNHTVLYSDKSIQCNETLNEVSTQTNVPINNSSEIYDTSMQIEKINNDVDVEKETSRNFNTIKEQLINHINESDAVVSEIVKNYNKYVQIEQPSETILKVLHMVIPEDLIATSEKMIIHHQKSTTSCILNKKDHNYSLEDNCNSKLSLMWEKNFIESNDNNITEPKTILPNKKSQKSTAKSKRSKKYYKFSEGAHSSEFYEEISQEQQSSNENNFPPKRQKFHKKNFKKRRYSTFKSYNNSSADEEVLKFDTTKRKKRDSKKIAVNEKPRRKSNRKLKFTNERKYLLPKHPKIDVCENNASENDFERKRIIEVKKKKYENNFVTINKNDEEEINEKLLSITSTSKNEASLQPKDEIVRRKLFNNNFETESKIKNEIIVKEVESMNMESILKESDSNGNSETNLKTVSTPRRITRNYSQKLEILGFEDVLASSFNYG